VVGSQKLLVIQVAEEKKSITQFGEKRLAGKRGQMLLAWVVWDVLLGGVWP